MKPLMYALAIVMIVMFTSPAFAVDSAEAAPSPNLKVEVDLSTLPDEVRNQVINAINGKVPVVPVVPGSVEAAIEDSGKVAKYMNEFAVGLKEVCTVLSVEVNDFIKTPVGAITTGVVLYKVLDGGGLISYLKEFFLLMPFALVGWVFFVRGFKQLIYGRNIKVAYIDDDGKKQFKYEFREAQWPTITTDDTRLGVFLISAASFGCLVAITLVAIL